MSHGAISGALAAALTPLRDGGDRLDEDAFSPLYDFYGSSTLAGVLAPRSARPDRAARACWHRAAHAPRRFMLLARRDRADT
jgi:hypothetical protein